MYSKSNIPMDRETEELRKLILGELLNDIEHLRDTVNEPEKLAEAIAGVLSKAILITHRKNKDASENLIDTLIPLIENTIAKSAQQNHQPLSNGLAPVMGPAIRKAVNSAFKQFNDSANTLAENTFSPKAVKWRMQALFSNRSFGDIVMRNTLEFKVKQVFLIHAQTGLLLHQETDGSVEAENADMISSMLTAIQDFVSDSFDSEKDQPLETVEVGELTLLMERGAQVVVAAVTYGTTPANYREVLNKTMLRIQRQFAFELNAFEGDTSPYAEAEVFLKPCMISKSKDDGRKRRPVFRFVLLGLLLLLGGYYLYGFVEKQFRWNEFVDDIESRKVVMVVDEGWSRGEYTIKGIVLTDTLQVDQIMREHKIDPNSVNANWVSINNAVNNHIEEQPRDIVLNETAYYILNDTLFLEQHVMDTLQESDHIPLMNKYNVTAIVADVDLFLRIANQVEDKVIYFNKGSSMLSVKAQQKLEQISKLFPILQRLDEKRLIRLTLHGYADTSGKSENINIAISEKRAKSVYLYLAENGVPENMMVYVGEGVRVVDNPSTTPSSEYRIVKLMFETKTND